MTGQLATILTKLIALSDHDGQPHSSQLARGLVIVAHVQPSKFTVRVQRRGQQPSLQEWQTVCANLPESHKPPTPVTPALYSEHNHIILSASWQLPARLF